MGKNKNRRRAQGQKKAAEQQRHNRNVSSASSSTAPGGSTAPSTPVHGTPFSKRQNRSDSGEEEEEEGRGKEVTAEGAGGEKDGGDTVATDETRIDGELLHIQPVALPHNAPPLPVRRRPITRQRLLVGGLWSAAFLSLMVQMYVGYLPSSFASFRPGIVVQVDTHTWHGQ
ncbi:hypothetical protein PG999_002101 [Apiospora kogelbergensis]|uniref:Uncharacterized protein n=1 Tax=Apiospora kogelbergensis TaxID=1337665 RepID=A0AAW0R7E5_9PEZI